MYKKTLFLTIINSQNNFPLSVYTTFIVQNRSFCWLLYSHTTHDERIYMLWYADDIALLAEKKKDPEAMLTEIDRVLGKYIINK